MYEGYKADDCRQITQIMEKSLPLDLCPSSSLLALVQDGDAADVAGSFQLKIFTEIFAAYAKALFVIKR